MSGPTIVSSEGINTVPNQGWKIVGNGDYNGDGKADILWRHSGSWPELAVLDGRRNASYSSVGINTVPTIWNIVGDGDYNGDGKSDILWRSSTTGQNWMYLMNGATISNSLGINTVATRLENRQYKLRGFDTYAKMDSCDTGSDRRHRTDLGRA